MSVLRLPGVPEQNVLVAPDRPHVEIIDTSTRKVWQSLEPVSQEAFDALEVEPPYRLVGRGAGTMDAHGFRRSPGAAEDGAMEFAEFGGATYCYCARPGEKPERPAGSGGPILLLVDKHHAIAFEAEREIDVITLPDGGEYLHVVEGGEGKAALELPEGWTLETRLLDEPLVLALPSPTRAFFFPNGDSFQGPI